MKCFAGYLEEFFFPYLYRCSAGKSQNSRISNVLNCLGILTVQRVRNFTHFQAVRPGASMSPLCCFFIFLLVNLGQEIRPDIPGLLHLSCHTIHSCGRNKREIITCAVLISLVKNRF